MKPINKLALLAIVGLLIYAAAQKQGPAPEPIPELGSKRVVVLRESGDSSPGVAAAIRNLQDGPAHKHFADKAVKLQVLDQDALNEDGEQAVEPKDYEGKQPPVVIIYRRSKPVYVEALPKEFTAEQIVSICEAHGA